MKTLLLCSTHNDLGLIRALKKIGAEIVITGNIENLPGQKFADKYIKADYSKKDLILSIAEEEKIDTICPCCNDYGVYTATYVAEKLNLPGHDSYENILQLHNKDKFKELAEKLNLLTPKAKQFDDIQAAEKFLSGIDYPVIVKPVDASAGNGVFKIDTGGGGEIHKLLKDTFEKSRSKKIVAEKFLSGSRHGLCTYLINQKVVAVCSNNEYSFINPYRVEIDTFPSVSSEDTVSFLVQEIETVAKHLRLKDGIFHLQYIMHNGKPYIIEVMRRVLGNMYSVPANMLCGFDWDYWEVRARCAMSLNFFPRQNFQEGYFAYKTVLGSKNGVIEKIFIPPEYEKYITGSFFLMQAGDEITDYKSRPVGFLFFQFSSQDEMQKVLIDNFRNDLAVMKSE